MPLVVEPDWVGRRVVIRHAVDRDETGRLLFSDTVGDLLEVTSSHAVVRTRGGDEQVPLGHVGVAKVVEPSAADILALEAITARGWRAAETADLGGWLLRANGGFTRRANSVLPLRRPAGPLDETLDAARAWYAKRGLPLAIQLPMDARRLLDAELAELGWAPASPTQVLATRIPPLGNPDEREREVRILGAPDDDWMARYRGGRTPAQARGLLTRHDHAGFAEVRRDGRTVAIGRGAVDDGWLGITAVEVDPAFRGHGLAAAVLRALWRWGAQPPGTTHSYVQVEADNDAALALYERLGYWHHHHYWYRFEAGPDGVPV